MAGREAGLGWAGASTADSKHRQASSRHLLVLLRLVVEILVVLVALGTPTATANSRLHHRPTLLAVLLYMMLKMVPT